MTGQVHPSSTDVYFSTQDNDIWASSDSGASYPYWTNNEGFNIQLAHAAPSPTSLYATACSACERQFFDAYFQTRRVWNDAPGATGDPVLVAGTTWLQPAGSILERNTNVDVPASWQAVPGVTLPADVGFGYDIPVVVGPANDPTVYIAGSRGAGWGLIRIRGVLGTSPAVTDADVGLGHLANAGSNKLTSIFAADPANPNHLIAAEDTDNVMKVSTNGGASWTVDQRLTDLVTAHGTLAFALDLNGAQVHSIAFDPTNPRRIFVGTEAAGIIASDDSGQTWNVLPGSKAIPIITSFFVDEGHNTVLVSSYGRGLWKLAMQ